MTHESTATGGAPYVRTASGIVRAWAQALGVQTERCPGIAPESPAADAPEVAFTVVGQDGREDERRLRLDSFRSVLKMVLALGEGTESLERAMHLIGDGERRLAAIVPPSPRPRVIVLLAVDPPTIAGWWFADMIQLAGGEAVGRPGPVSHQELEDLDPDVLVVISNHRPLHETRSRLRAVADDEPWRRLRAIRTKRVYFFDGARHFLTPGRGIFNTIIDLHACLTHGRP